VEKYNLYILNRFKLGVYGCYQFTDSVADGGESGNKEN